MIAFDMEIKGFWGSRGGAITTVGTSSAAKK